MIPILFFVTVHCGCGCGEPVKSQRRHDIQSFYGKSLSLSRLIIMSIRIAACYTSSIARMMRSKGNNKSFPRGGSPVSRSLSSEASGAPMAPVGRIAAKEAAVEATSAPSDNVPVGMTLVAMILAIGTVSAGATLAENATASLVPIFDPKQQRFNQSTFFGRLSKMLLACDPFLLTYSNEEVKGCKAMVDDYEYHLKNLPGGVSETEMSRKLWEAQVNKFIPRLILANSMLRFI